MSLLRRRPRPVPPGPRAPVALYYDPTRVTLENGQWYAFRMDGVEFFATVHNDGGTGFLELRPIADPYVCLDCGKRWHEGEHGEGGHLYNPRGGERAGGYEEMDREP